MNSTTLGYEKKLEFFRSVEFKVGPPEVDLYHFRGEAVFKRPQGSQQTHDMDLK